MTEINTNSSSSQLSASFNLLLQILMYLQMKRFIHARHFKHSCTHCSPKLAIRCIQLATEGLPTAKRRNYRHSATFSNLKVRKLVILSMLTQRHAFYIWTHFYRCIFVFVSLSFLRNKIFQKSNIKIHSIYLK